MLIYGRSEEISVNGTSTKTSLSNLEQLSRLS
jgi:hypothetical protein